MKNSKKMKELKIEKATIDKVGDLLMLFGKYQDFYGASVIKNSNEEFLKDVLSGSEKGIFHVAYFDNQPVGFSGVYFSYSSVLAKKIAIINDLFILTDFRKQGFGRLLIDETINFLKEGKVVNIRWCTKSDNLDAQNLYNNLDVGKSDWIHYDLKI